MAASIRDEARKRYKSKRLEEAFIFLKSITFDGSKDPSNFDLTDDCQGVEQPSTSQHAACPINDPSLALLISSASLEVCRPHLMQSVSVTGSVNAEEEIKHQKVGTDADHAVSGESDIYNKMTRSKSSVETTRDLVSKVIRLRNFNNWNDGRQQLYGKRILFVSQRQVPYQSFSVIPYKKMDSFISYDKRHSTLHIASTVTSGNFIEDIDMGDGKREVSYSHLLIPESWKHKSYLPEEGEQGIQDSHIIEYDPLAVDDPRLISGKHRTVLNLPSFMVSIIQYAKPSEVKKDVNERFKEKFPHVTITLSKLRSLKAELMEVSLQMALDVAVVACAFIYFEKVVLRTRITKYNRKYIAGACLLLSIKFTDDIKSKNIKFCIEEICYQFRLSTKDLLSCELQVLILLEFALVTPQNEAMPMYKRLETSIS